jgi:integrase
MFDVNFNLRYRRPGKSKVPDYSLPATIVFVVNINGNLSTPRVTGVEVIREDWDFSAQKIKGSSEDVQLKNKRLRRIKADLDHLEHELSAMMELLTAQHLVDVYVGKKQKRLTVSKAFENHLDTIRNPDHKEDILKEKSLTKWERSKELVEEFLKSIKMENLPVIHFTLPMAEQYRRFMAKKYKFGKDHTSRNLSYLRTAFQEAKKIGEVPYNPIYDVELPRNRPKKPEPLTLLELQRLIDFRAKDIWLQQSADAAIFMCFTGLDHCDYMNFDVERHIIMVEDVKVIRMVRQKMCRKGYRPDPVDIPILPEAMAILDKYHGYLPKIKYKTILDQVKQIMSIIRVTKNISMKNLRKTCGTYLLNKGVRMEVIRDVMGHETIAITEKIYTIVYPETIVKAFRHLLIG